MNVRDLFDNQYLAADDLRGKDWTFTISRVEPVKLRKKDGSGFDSRGRVYFAELDAKGSKDKPAKSLVLNRTNAATIKALYGKETKAWAGKMVTLYPTTCRVGKETRDCIRIRPDEPEAASKPKPSATSSNQDGPEPPDGALESDRVG